MAIDLAALIDEARSEAFVGRTAELASFDAALSEASLCRVLLVHGPGGIGKTTLLHQFRLRAGLAGRALVFVDARVVDCSPEGLHAALSGTGGPIVDEVVFIDGYERLDPIDGWVRDTFLPSVGAGSVVVLAGRDAPPAPWRSDPGLRAVVAVHCLDTFDAADSVELLARAGVAGSGTRHLASLGRGHPLTLALLADAATAGSVPTDLAAAPDLVAALVAQVVGDVPDDDHMLALAACAHTWLTTEDLLRRVVGDRAAEIWRWLETRPFVNRGPDGLYPHDLVRDVLEAETRRRSPDGYRRLHRLIRDHAIAAMRQGDLTERHLGAHQFIYLHRDSPITSVFWTMRERGPAAVVPGSRDDHRAVLDMVERFEGLASAELAERWLDAQPENLFVAHTSGRLAGFALAVIHPADPSLCEGDPVVRTALDEAARVSPARPGEQISVGRFFSGASDHQRDPYAVLCGPISSLGYWLTRPLAWSFIATIDAEFWGPQFDYIGFTTQLTVDAAGHRHAIYGIDWRRLPVDAWLDMMGERELTGVGGPPPAELLRPPPLDRSSFAEAVKGALRCLRAPDRLQASPLMGSALARGVEGPSSDRLQATLVDAIEWVGDEPRAEPLHRVLDRTFVHAAPTQEGAAEVLDLPFSTYRRHLAKAIERLTDLLWAVEIGEVRPTR